jgi:transposase
MQIRSVGIDLGKTTFHLVALDDNGKVLLIGVPDLLCRWKS